MVQFRLFSTLSTRSSTRTTKDERQPPPPSPSPSATSQQHQRRRLSIKKLFKQQQQQHPQPLPQPQPPQEQLEILNSPITLKPTAHNRRSVSETNSNNLYSSPNPSFLLEQQINNTTNTNPLSVITAKLRPNRLTHKSSAISLVESIKPSTNNFALKSFRNVRTTPNPPPEVDTPTAEQPPEPAPAPAAPAPPTTTLSRPASITSISRPSSPSSKISAAAFREARAARNSRASISSSFSDIAAIPNLIHPDPSPQQQQQQQPITKHARFKSSPAKAVSDYGHPPSSSPVKNFNRPYQQRSGAPSLISQIPDRHAASPIPPSPAGFPANSGLYAEHDILMPPRPAFYGSRMSVRSISSEQSPSRQSYAGPRISATLNRASTGAPAGLYNNPRASSSNASIRSVPVVLRHQQPHHQHPARLRSTTTTTTTPKKSQGQDPRHLDQWHSDDDDDPKPASAKPVRDEDEDEDEVPLSKLKKKSCSSLRDPLRAISPAQTLIRTRHQLHASVIHPFSSASSASASVFSSSGASTDDRRASVVSARSGGDKAARHLSHIPPLPLLRPDLSPAPSSSTALKSQQTGSGNLAGHPRGNSPASSSSGGSGSGSGSWNFPATPRDSFLPVPTHIHPHPHPAFALLAGPGYLMPGPPGSSAPTQPDGGPNLSISDGQTFGTGGEGAAAVGGAGGGRPPPVGPDASPENPAGYWTASPAPPAPAGSVDDLPTPVGVDPYLYAGLDTAQKIALHQRSQLILQMMAVQAQTAAQMHALAAANGPAHSLVSSGHGHRASASVVSVGPVPQPRIAPSSLHHQRAATGDFDAGGNADGSPASAGRL